MTITVALLAGTHLRTTAHLNGGREWFGYLFQCIEYPRLQRLDRYYRKDRNVVSVWKVDGQEVESLDAAAEALNVPPILTPEEAVALALVPDEFTNLRQVENLIAGCERLDGIRTSGAIADAITLLHALRNKGAVELGKSPERSDGQPWADSVPEHLRFSPTIRKARTA